MFKLWSLTRTFVHDHPRLINNYCELYLVLVTEMTREKPASEKKSKTRWDEYQKDFEMYDEFAKRRKH